MSNLAIALLTTSPWTWLLLAIAVVLELIERLLDWAEAAMTP